MLAESNTSPEIVASFIRESELIDPRRVPSMASIEKAAHAAQLAIKGDTQWFGADQIMDVYNWTKQLATHIHDEAVTDTVYLDRAGRPIRYAVSEYWRNAYPNEQQPTVHFMNPSLGLPIDEGRPILRPIRNALRKRTINREVKHAPNRFQSLGEAGKSILVIDGCAHSGLTLDAAKLLLQKLGAKNITMAVFDDEHTGVTRPSHIKKFSNLQYGCMPFGTDISFRTDNGKLFATALTHPDLRRNSLSLRQEISRIIAIGRAAEQNKK